MKHIITIKGEAQTDYSFPEKLNGIICDDEFTEYFGEKYRDDDNEQCLIDKGVCNGYLYFMYNNGKLWSVVTYDSPEELNAEELKILTDYTQGQLSDGIGEGYEQHECYIDENGEEAYISPWFNGQELIVEQVCTNTEFDSSESLKENQ